MTISRGQMERQLRMGGGIMDVVPREPAIFGGIKRSVKKAVKGATKAVKKIASSDVGKAALLYAGTAGLGSLAAGKGFGSLMQLGTYAPSTVLGNLGIAGTNFFKGKAIGVDKFDNIIRSQSGLSKVLGSIGLGGGGKGMGNVGKVATLGLVSKFLTDTLGMPPEQAEAELARDPSTYLEQYYRNLNPPTADTNSEQYEAEVRDFVVRNTSEYAVGGRVGFADGPVLPPDPTQPVNPFGPKPGDFGIEEDIPIKTASYGFDEAMSDTYDSYLEMKRKGLIPPTMDFDEFLQEVVPNMSNKRIKETRSLAAIGGKMDTASDNAMQAAGIEGLPVRQNKAGVKELDLRETGGFIQPVGIKEKEDDIPAMLSNNEFVMTADAVRGMGGGDVNLGAQRMYDQMKMLEAGGKV